MISRDNYLDILKRFKDKQLIKVLSGIRRCGKSTLFTLYQSYLLENNVNSNQIISINLEDLEYDFLHDHKSLYNYIKSKLVKNNMNYIFIDEIQNIEGYEKVVDSLIIKDNCDVYITGSNAYLLSGELATVLSGRYVEINMLPLSFSEFNQYFDNENLNQLYNKYLNMSSFPYAVNFSNKKDIRLYLSSLVDSIIIKDILFRKKYEIDTLKSIIKFMFSNIGNITSSKKIADTLTSLGKKITVNTIDSYLNSLTDSYIFYKVGRYDIKGKNHLKTLDKYYASDLGLRYNILGSNNVDDGSVLENIVFLELIRRGNEVYIGKVDEYEVDFVTINEEGIVYYQVSYTVADESTLNRELRSLRSIKDSYPKILLTMDYNNKSHDGITQKNVLEWLLEK